MKNRVLVVILGFFLFSGLAVQAAPFAYTADGDTVGGNLYRIDLASNTLTTVGAITGTEIEGLAFGPGPVLYGIVEGGTDLLSLNTTTAAVSVVGALGVSVDNHGMSYCQDTSSMYLANDGGELYTVNLATGAATLVGIDLNYFPTALTCTQAGVLFAISDFSDSLYTVNRTTGQATLVGALGINIADGGLARNGTQLIMVSDNSPANLYQLNPTTGVASLITQLNAGGLNLESLSVDSEVNAVLPAAPEKIPTLSLWAFPILISFLMLVGKRRRKSDLG